MNGNFASTKAKSYSASGYSRRLRPKRPKPNSTNQSTDARMIRLLKRLLERVCWYCKGNRYVYREIIGDEMMWGIECGICKGKGRI